MTLAFLQSLIQQLLKEHIPDTVMEILSDDFMTEKEQLFTSIATKQYPENIDLLQATLTWAKQQHGTQPQIITLIPNTVYFPYFNHPLSVALYAMSLQLPCPMIQACLLHDVIEDCACKEKEIFLQRGKTVSRYVTMLSKTKKETHGTYFKRITQSPLPVRQIKALDIFHNLIRALTLTNTSYLQRLLKEADEYYLPLFANDKKLSSLRLKVEKIFQAVAAHCKYTVEQI